MAKSISNDVSKIDLSHNCISRLDQKLLGLVVSAESRLGRLSLENNKLGDKAVEELCRTAAYSKHLKSLNVRKNFLTN